MPYTNTDRSSFSPRLRGAASFVLILAAGGAVSAMEPAAGRAVAALPGVLSGAVEVSADGRSFAIPGEVGAITTRGSGSVAARFSTTPDFELSLRRQCGGLAVTDIDGDGANDLVVVCYSSNSFPPYPSAADFILFNTGSGLSSTPGWVAATDTHTADLLVADFNGDERPDFVTIHGGSVRTDAVRIYYNTPAGPPTTPDFVSNIPGRAWGTAGVLVDVDQDNDLDLVTTNQGLSPDPFRPILQFRNDGGVFTTAPVWQSAEQSIQNGAAVGDFDNDGWPDLAVAKWANFESGIYYNTGAGAFSTTPGWTVGADGTDRGAAVADVDGNGTDDPYFGGDPSVGFSNDGVGNFTQTWMNTDPFSGPQEFRFHDADGDGDQDLAEIHFSTGRGFLYENVDGVIGNDPVWTYDATEVGTALAFGDVNGDGLDDLVLGFSGDICVRVFYAIAPECQADITGEGEVNIFDILAYLDLWESMDPAAELTGNGTIDIFDILAYLDLWTAGCP